MESLLISSGMDQTRRHGNSRHHFHHACSVLRRVPMSHTSANRTVVKIFKAIASSLSPVMLSHQYPIAAIPPLVT